MATRCTVHYTAFDGLLARAEKRLPLRHLLQPVRLDAIIESFERVNL